MIPRPPCAQKGQSQAPILHERVLHIMTNLLTSELRLGTYFHCRHFSLILTPGRKFK